MKSVCTKKNALNTNKKLRPPVWAHSHFLGLEVQYDSFVIIREPAGSGLFYCALDNYLSFKVDFNKKRQ